MGPHHHIDIYCERLEPGLWAEPINAVTNIAFFIAGFFALKYARDHDALNKSTITLVALIFAMGVGSTLFHTFANLWSMAADILPILLYQMLFIIFYSRHRIKLSWTRVVILLGAFIILMQAMMQLPRSWLNGSLEYAPALIFVLGFGVWHYFNAARERWILLAAGAVFALSMTFRSIDMAVCDSLEIGTHYLWHILNGTVLYLTARGYIQFKR